MVANGCQSYRIMLCISSVVTRPNHFVCVNNRSVYIVKIYFLQCFAARENTGAAPSVKRIVSIVGLFEKA
jgi:hypothetical protein